MALVMNPPAGFGRPLEQLRHLLGLSGRILQLVNGEIRGVVIRIERQRLLGVLERRLGLLQILHVDPGEPDQRPVRERTGGLHQRGHLV